MANELMGMIWLIEFPSGPMRWTMAKICDCADPDGTNIFPSVATIAEETNLCESSVRASIAAFEQCGLLAVKGEKFGNRYGKTTVIRELDTGLLKLITGKRVKGKPKIPSTHVLRRVDVDVAAGANWVQHPNAVHPSLIDKPPGESCNMRVWAIMPRDLSEDTNPNVAPLPAGGVENGCPSIAWSPPLQEVEVAPPADGANPSIDPSLDPPPQSPANGGRRRGTKFDEVDETLCRLVAERPGDDARRFAVDVVLRPIVVLRKFDAASFEHGLRVLADWIATKSLSEAESARIVDRILDTRRASVKPSDIEDEVRAAIVLRPQRPTLAGDEALMARWPSVLEALNGVIGREKVAAWFSTIVIVGVSGQRVELATHLPPVPARVEQDFGDHLRWALSKVYGLSKFNLVARRAAA